MKSAMVFAVALAATLCTLSPVRAEEYEEIRAVPCDTNPDEVFRMGLEFRKVSIRQTADRCNTESTAEVVMPNYHTVVIDPSVPDQICGIASHGSSDACAWFIRKVLAGHGLAPIQESAHIVRIVPLSSVKPGQPLADMSW